MGFFSKKNNASPTEANLKINWIELDDISQLKEIKSNTKTSSIFKHSTRCGISRMVKKQFENGYSLNNDEMDMYYLDLLNHRDISNAISDEFNIVHESPQLIIIKNGEAIFNTSHGDINEIELAQYI
ncbi:bacillithiol system redox-active protein YtxJ [Urechidicola croceus]|uniref:Cytosolic protein n=1 Tax=Urechidicola croceus TaxID=1850246 RepID=A0A1D8P5P9_9FLAO|nr:bacillithiol system redox-active protein YtxJ [Urechidicola croceus]AOW19861.1 hypothetical protein LPB138_03795 [Urechidicola croceus]